MPIRVIVVDDSRLMREMIRHSLSADPEIEVVATAIDPIDARTKIRDLNPDVITLDVEMPRMDGISFLEKIMTLKPTAVVMFSSLTHQGADITLRALEIGAVDFLTKPVNLTPESFRTLGADLVAKVKSAAAARVGTSRHVNAAPKLRTNRPSGAPQRELIAIGASTGGVEAIRALLLSLPLGLPPIVITQHMPAGFTARFAQRMSALGPHKVHEAEDRMPLQAGNVYIAAGDHHMEVVQGQCRVRSGETVSGHRPSVDVMFHSIAKSYGARAVGVILTGMGRDGAEGLLAMRRAGAATRGQDASSSLIYGMPRAAMEVGAVEREAALEHMGGEIVDSLYSMERAMPGL